MTKHLGDQTLEHFDWFWQPQDDVFLLFAILFESSSQSKGWWHRGEDANAVS